MKKNLTIVTSSILTTRDYKRLLLKKLKKDFNISIINCQKLFDKKKKIKIVKNKNYYYPENLFDLKKIFKYAKPYIVYDRLGLNFKLITSLIRFYINLRFNCFYFDGGPKVRVKIDFTKKKFFLILKNYLFKLIFSKFVFFNTTFAVSGRYRISFFENLSNRNILYTHSSDYETFLSLKKNKKKFYSFKYAVFLDENIPDHTEYKINNMDNPISKKEYYKIIKNFFKNLEKKLKIKIIIALHPRSNKHEFKKYFEKYRIIQNKTAQLVKDSKFVIAHVSTSLSYAVLFNKKIITLTSNTLDSSWIGNEISVYQKLLGSIMINLDKYDLKNIKKLKINRFKYRNYINNFLKHPNSRDPHNIPYLLNKIEYKNLR